MRSFLFRGLAAALAGLLVGISVLHAQTPASYARLRTVTGPRRAALPQRLPPVSTPDLSHFPAPPPPPQQRRDLPAPARNPFRRAEPLTPPEARQPRPAASCAIGPGRPCSDFPASITTASCRPAGGSGRCCWRCARKRRISRGATCIARWRRMPRPSSGGIWSLPTPVRARRAGAASARRGPRGTPDHHSGCRRGARR